MSSRNTAGTRVAIASAEVNARYTQSPRPSSTPRRSAALASSAVWRALTAAAADVCAEWPHREHGATSAVEVRSSLGVLTENVRQALNGDSIAMVAFPPFVPVRRALELLRRAFLERSEPLGTQAEGEMSVLDVIKAMERVQHALDEDAAHRFAARLSGQDAQQLVVEMAHDMRSPLGSILILAERLRYGVGRRRSRRSRSASSDSSTARPSGSARSPVTSSSSRAAARR